MGDMSEVRRFAADWFRKLDVHAPIDEVAALVAADVEFQLPEGSLRSRDDFRKWYATVTAIFFDETHELTFVDARGDTDTQTGADVAVVLRWEASFWKPPAAWSRRLNMVARQRWTVGREAGTGRLIIRKYAVDALEPLPGSAPLPTA